MKNIVIFLQNRNFFGTQITHIPLLNYVKEIYPSASISLFSKHKISNIFLDLKLVDRIVLEKNKFQILEKYLSLKADITITLRRNSTFTSSMIILLNRGEKIGFKTTLTNIFFKKVKEYDSTIYRANNYLNLLDSTISLSNQNNDSKELLIMPGAGGKYKIWDLKNYIKLASYLHEIFSDYTISFVLGSNESHFMDTLESENFNIYFNEPIQVLSKTVKNARLVIANDCGPSHLAHIYDVPRILLLSDEFGSASSILKEWFFHSPNAHYIIGQKEKNINSIMFQDVQELSTQIIMRAI